MLFPFLLIDVGNTRLKWATAPARPGAKIQLHGAVATPEAEQIRRLGQDAQFKNHQVILSCVVPKLLPVFRSAFGPRLRVVLNGQSPHLSYQLQYPRPEQIGADRLADAQAAHSFGIFPAVTINCGTATVLNVLDAQSRFIGGVILPGWHVQLTALTDRAAQLPTIAMKPTRHFIAKSTEEALRAGALLSFRGGIKESLREITARLKVEPEIYLTGGNVGLVGKDLGVEFTLKPLLTFTGLHIIGLNSLKTL